MIFFNTKNNHHIINKKLADKAINKSNSIVKYLLPEMKDNRKQYPANIPYTDHVIILDNEDILTIRIYRPKQNNPFTLPPTIFHIPATAFILNIEEQGCYFHEVTGSLLAELSGCNVVIIKHRVSPKKTPLDQMKDCYNIFNMVCENSDKLNINIKDIVMTGYCTGATFANAISLYLSYLHSKKNNEKCIKYEIKQQILVSILTDLTCTDKGYGEIEKSDKSTSKDFIKKVIEYSGIFQEEKKYSLLSSFWQNWKKVNKSFYPRTDIFVGANDVLFGDSEKLYKQLKKHGFKTTFTSIPDGNHGSFWFDRKVIEGMAYQIKKCFNICSISKYIKDENTTNSALLSIVPFEEKKEQNEAKKNNNNSFRISC